MLIFPAIDLFEKKAVRLFKGDYKQMTVYSNNPIEIAKKFEEAGAEWIHTVDLEGAKDGTTPNLSVIEEICKNTNLKVEIGGGIRSMETVRKYFSVGVQRVILGTAAVNDRAFLLEAVNTFGDKIAVGVDLKDGFVAVRGWEKKSDWNAEDFSTSSATDCPSDKPRVFSVLQKSWNSGLIRNTEN